MINHLNSGTLTVKELNLPEQRATGRQWPQCLPVVEADPGQADEEADQGHQENHDHGRGQALNIQ